MAVVVVSFAKRWMMVSRQIWWPWCKSSSRQRGTRGRGRRQAHFVPALASDTLDDDVHDVDGKVEVGLLLDELAETVDRRRSEGSVLCERRKRQRQLKSWKERSSVPLTSDSHISRKRL